MEVTPVVTAGSAASADLRQQRAGSHSGLLHASDVCRADVVQQLGQQGEKNLQTHTISAGFSRTPLELLGL